jgi:hypothetical protein
MPKKTLSDVAREHGLTRDQLNAARTQGVDPWNPEAVAEWAATRRPRVAKTATLAKEILNDDTAGGDVTLESIERELKHATVYESVKILKEKLAGLKTAMQVRQEMRELVPIGEVDERDTRIAAAMKAAILRLCNDAAPQVEGLEAAKAHKVLMAEGKKILDQLADEQSEFWKGTMP